MQYPFPLFPLNIKKYKGCKITEDSKEFTVHIKTKEILILQERFNTYDEAFYYLLTKKKELDLPVSNMVYELEDCFQVELTQNKSMYCSKRDILSVENYVWAYHKERARGKVNGKRIFFANFILNAKRVTYLDGNTLNNRRSNLLILQS